MILILHWSLGDHACYTGIPEAYYKYFGSKLTIVGDKQYDDLWKNNEFADRNPKENDRSYKFVIERLGIKQDWTMYRPQRIFYEMTGVVPDRTDVQPKLYRNRNPVKKRVVFCDEAGWACRRGYEKFDGVVSHLNKFGYETCLIRNVGYGPKQITCAARELRLSLNETIEFLATAEMFVGYDSGLAHLSAGVGTPYIMLTAATPPVVVRHDLCVMDFEACDHCCLDNCSHNCLAKQDYNDMIIERIKQICG